MVIPLHVALWAMDQLGLRTRLQALGIGPSLRHAAIGPIVARMARPGSERAARRWLTERSALGELLGVDFETLELMQLYRASDARVGHLHEFSPSLDVGTGITSYLAAHTVLEFLGNMYRQPHHRLPFES